ncbi:zinc finger CCCH domain-containing protein 39-like [Vicia villosa]|uniref:zinc finger CCCH domain-containing protein 39-like n=1 Tax=Vicia villosa TaxID=3911 RepID=UPI00273C96AF|nr:zinc finger CCCH domain-containing protein 39-like [Vicia villosa]XP_058760489.1 zinc finger CCCH domain-containing protein 39-like [Vicia villosa]XP_058760494.1 zinc finger CCCH domain-containing protein 39-like [Vicia villosa]
MSHSNNIPTFKMSPFSSSSSSDIIEVTPQFPMTMSNERYEHNQRSEPRSASDGSHSFIRTRVPDNMQPNARMGPPTNRETGNIFFKTRICTKFGFGTCRNGQNCTFAHGADDIRRPPPNWQELVGPRTEERLQLGGNGNWSDDQKIIHKMKLCKKYCNGEECPYGDKCNFLHEDPAKFRDDSWKPREYSAINIETSNNSEGSRAGTKQEKGTYWKTKMCLRWLNTGSCPFGDGCHFAHGDAELQVPGGDIEDEAAVAIANSTRVVVPTLPTTGSSANYAPTTLPANVPATTDEERKAKKELLWKKLNKINRIYGDWIDDLPPDLPSTTEP